MIALIGAIIGLFGAAIPEILKFLNNKEDHKHEQAMMDKQAEIEKARHGYRIEEIQVEAEARTDIEEMKSLHKRGEVSKTGIKWIDGALGLLNGSVRPVITYAFVTLYFLVKNAQYQIARENMTTWQATKELWNEPDVGVFSCVVTYWFGQRGMRYVLGKLSETR
ncbi:MAG: hypothetical protein JXA50_01910 [Deltaproteobacteria bacterium]|nr:hypothetical protein [Deltaproteobacteria bacterium]